VEEAVVTYFIIQYLPDRIEESHEIPQKV